MGSYILWLIYIVGLCTKRLMLHWANGRLTKRSTKSVLHSTLYIAKTFQSDDVCSGKISAQPHILCMLFWVCVALNYDLIWFDQQLWECSNLTPAVSNVWGVTRENLINIFKVISRKRIQVFFCCFRCKNSCVLATTCNNMGSANCIHGPVSRIGG